MRGSQGMVAAAGMLVLVIGMGFGRFAFTGLSPLMIAEGQITVEVGSYAASANYAGYLVGALLTALLSGIPSRRLCLLATVTTVVTLAMFGFPLSDWEIVAIRALSGLSSAMAMVAASHWLIQDHRHHDGASALFSGVGLGILVSAELIAVGHMAGLPSHTLWLLLALISLIVAVPATLIQFDLERSKTTASGTGPNASHDDKDALRLGPAKLILIYGLAGLGYIVTATYLPLLVKTAIPSLDPAHLWAVFGLAAAPSCFLWHALRVRWGTRRALFANLLAQAVGVVLPVTHQPIAYVVSALLVGGTFMGTVTIAISAARILASKVRFNMLAIMTAAYGVGQIVGPLIANDLYGRTGSFDASLVVAAGALGLAAVIGVASARNGGEAARPQHAPSSA